jgi:hypothetical protein
MEQKSRAERLAEIRQELLLSIRNTDNIIRNLNEGFERSERRKREIRRSYRERRLRRLLAQDAA